MVVRVLLWIIKDIHFQLYALMLFLLSTKTKYYNKRCPYDSYIGHFKDFRSYVPETVEKIQIYIFYYKNNITTFLALFISFYRYIFFSSGIISAWSTFFISSCSASLPVINLVFVYLKNFFILLLLLKDIFARYKILPSYFFLLVC